MIRLLIADDMEDIRTYLSEEITACARHIEVVGQAASGAEAVALTQALRPDVVLMDVQMETMAAGIDAIEIIHRAYPEIRCVTLSIHQNDEYMLRAYLVGACAYIVKTSTPEDIVRSIDNVMKNTLQLQPEVAARIIQEYQRIKQDESVIKDILRVIMKISASEYEILRLVYDGYTYQAIAEQRFVQETTIRSQVNHILKKFNKKRMRDVIRMLRDVSFFDKLE